MVRFSGSLAIVTWLIASAASAGNKDEVNAGVDVTLTGGAVVAKVASGAALWYNPAGLARFEDSSFELTGITLRMSLIRAPGLLTLETGEQSGERRFDISVIPEAITFKLPLKKLQLGIGLFNSSLRRELAQQRVSHPGDPVAMTPPAQWNLGANTRVDNFHVSTGVAKAFDKRKQKALVGGAFDLVISTARVDQLVAGLYDGGSEGLVSLSSLSNEAGFGLQLKGGVQWIPIPEVRLGLSISTPTYVFLLFERLTANESFAPPGSSADAPRGENSFVRSTRGGWFGVEPGTLRFGVAYVGRWGWVEGDLVVDFRLRTSRFLFNFRTVPNGRAAVVFNASRFVKLGLGVFTDLSQTEQLLAVGDRQVDFFGAHFGLLFTNYDSRSESFAPPDIPDKDKAHITVAIALRYAHGRGDILGLLLPAVYDPAAIQTKPVDAQINDIAINFGLKFSF
jgi:hypothetical protein